MMINMGKKSSKPFNLRVCQTIVAIVKTKDILLDVVLVNRKMRLQNQK